MCVTDDLFAARSSSESGDVVSVFSARESSPQVGGSGRSSCVLTPRSTERKVRLALEKRLFAESLFECQLQGR